MSRNLPSGPKRAILDVLLKEALSAREIARRLGVSAAAVRQHLASLLGGGLVKRERGEPRPGRPTYVYSLSPLARRSYPKRYDVLASELLEVLIERYGEREAMELVAKAARRVAGQVPALRTTAGSEKRWDRVLAWLEDTFALEAEVESLDPAHRRIVVHQCPLQDVPVQRPTVCGTFMATLIGELVGGANVTHEPLDDPVRCCLLEVTSPKPT